MEIKKSLVELPAKGKALVVTDIHGNFDDFNRYIELWEDFKSEDTHLILNGDYIHGMFNSSDSSIEILDSVMYHCAHSKNFHALLGNHEWSHVSGEPVFKSGADQKKGFELQIEKKFGDIWKSKLDQYIDFFKTLPIAVRTENGVFISHAAPARIKNIDSIINATSAGYGINNRILFELLWSRYPEDYNEKDIDVFLGKIGCKFSVVGHTPVEGYEIIGNQLIISSSFLTGRKCYLELDLEKKINGIKDLEGMIKEPDVKNEGLKVYY